MELAYLEEYVEESKEANDLLLNETIYAAKKAESFVGKSVYDRQEHFTALTEKAKTKVEKQHISQNLQGMTNDWLDSKQLELDISTDEITSRIAAFLVDMGLF